MKKATALDRVMRKVQEPPRELRGSSQTGVMDLWKRWHEVRSWRVERGRLLKRDQKARTSVTEVSCVRWGMYDFSVGRSEEVVVMSETF